jgi:hypothetical protein
MAVPDSPDNLPLAGIFRAANDLIAAGLIEDYALGGALAATGLTEEAVREAERIDYEGVPARIFRAEHIIAIAASVGRARDKARIEQLLQQADFDKAYLENILQRYKLKLPIS